MTIAIRSLTNPAEIFDGPDNAPIPAGYERMPASAAAPTTRTSTGDVLDIPTGAEPRSSSWLTRLPPQPMSATLPVRAVRLMTGVDAPQSMEDVALLALGNAPLIAAGGAGLGAVLPRLAPALRPVAPALGRIASSVALAKGRGEDTPSAVIEGLGATGAEAGIGMASKMLGGPARALDAIRQIIGHGPQGAVNVGVFDRLVRFWSAAENAAAKTIRAAGSPGPPAPNKILGIVPFLEQVDPTGVAALMFKEAVAKGAKIPLTSKAVPSVPAGLSQVAERVLTSPVTRGVADAAASADPTPGTLGLLGAADVLGRGASLNPMRLLK